MSRVLEPDELRRILEGLDALVQTIRRLKKVTDADLDAVVTGLEFIRSRIVEGE